jgi:hypothetical protein
MRLITNGINGRYLREITDNAHKDTDLVEAAVAYAGNGELLFEWCWDHKIPLRFWGRFDETLPVSLAILKRFLDRKSANFSCKLLTHFHPKVIWWHGFGAYIGSANLSDAAWYSNIEAGCFFDEAEMIAGALDIQLRTFFDRVDAHASPLTDELYKAIESRANELKRLHEQDAEQRKKFLATTSIKQWKGLAHVGSGAARDRQKKAFCDEWFETLQILRDIGSTVSQGDNRPGWIPSSVPTGVQADQFLHAHYYSHVIGDDRRSYYAEKHEENERDPAGALRNAMRWWHDLAGPPTGEDRTILEWAPVLRDLLSQDRILGLNESEFEEVCMRVWSIQDHARRVSNATLNLPDGERHDMDTKTKSLAKFLYSRRSKNGSSVLEVIQHVLYGGSDEALPLRLWEATSEGSWRIEHLGISALGELVGWALPEKFPPRNNRTSKALYSLGYPVTVHG